MRKSRISPGKQARLIEHFIAGTTARTAASLVGVHRNSAAFYFHRLRQIIAHELEVESEAMFGGEIEVDESYFGGKRKGKRGRGAAGKIPVFGLLKRGGKVYARVIPDAKGPTLAPIIERKVTPDSIVYTDSWQGYNALDVSSFKHCRINHSECFACLQQAGERAEPHQRDRELLESGQAPHAQIQRCSKGAFWAMLEGV